MEVQGVDPLAAELQQRVTMFHAGDELYSGQWLVNFQRDAGAWQICATALSSGPEDKSCDEELLHMFCSQTLARLSRGFSVRHEPDMQQITRNELQWLLALHAFGQKPVWKQLALATTSADLWLGCWTAAPLVSDQSMPVGVKRELLTLPTELLFCGRSLPLDNVHVRQRAAAGLREACASVFPFVLNGGISEEGEALRVLAAWLRAVKKSYNWLSTSDEAAPLRCLDACRDTLLSTVRAAPSEASELAQQLAKWKGSDAELSSLLNPILDILFIGGEDSPLFEEENPDHDAKLPLLSELASDCWPRAALGEFELDWQRVAKQALSTLAVAVVTNEEDSGNAEAAIGVWQTFAETISDGVSDEVVPTFGDAALPVLKDAKGFVLPSEKRVRRESAWHPAPGQVAQSQALPQLFLLLSQQLLESMRAPEMPDREALEALFAMRAAAASALSAWAALIGNAAAWQEATWAPLQRVGQTLMACGGAEGVSEETWREAEVVLWFSATLASSWPAQAGATPAASVVSELGAVLDAAPEPWRALLWSSACGLASTGAPDHCVQLAEWMLKRPPMAAGSLDLLELTELPYAKAMEAACRRLPPGSVHGNIGEGLVTLAFADRPADTVHSEMSEARALLLQALSHAMGGDNASLCRGLAQGPLPKLRAAAEAEANAVALSVAGGPRLAFSSSGEPEWHAVRALLSTLVAALPTEPVGPSADGQPPPVETLWREHWAYVEAALMKWPALANTEQPAAAACVALSAVARKLPALVPDAMQLLGRSASEDELPQAQLEVLRDIVAGSPCPPADPARMAEVFSTTILGISEALIGRAHSLLQSPETQEAFFALLAEAVRPSPEGETGKGPCQDWLRPMLLAQPAFTARILSLVDEALPECLSPANTSAMLLLAMRLVSGPGADTEAHRAAVVDSLPCLCAALCRALATQAHLSELDSLAVAAGLLTSLADALPLELAAPLEAGLIEAEVPEWSREPLLRHVAGRAEWPRKWEWLEHLRECVLEWQNERSYKVD